MRAGSSRKFWRGAAAGVSRAGRAGAAVLALAVLVAPAVGMLAAGCRPAAPRPEAAADGRLAPRRLVSAAEREQFLGDAACAECHARESRQRETRHARTLTPVDPAVHRPLFKKAGRRSDPLEELEFRTAVRDGRCVLTAAGPDGEKSAPADYAFGSGAVGYTYLARQGDRSLELRLSYYVHEGKWEFTPGQRMGGEANTPLGLMLDESQERACFACHTTALVREGSGLKPEQSLLGVTCEACHGPGAAHVQAARRGDRDLRMARLSAERARVSLELCGECHRAPERVDMHAPGMAEQLPRMQSVAMSMSGCFKKGGLSCVTCHDPHGDARDVTQAQYNAKCASCHDGSAGKPPCPVRPRGDCVSCHMPLQDVGLPTAPRFRNHWIKAW